MLIFLLVFIFLLDSEKLYADAMKDGYIKRKVIKCLIVGAAGVGKTSIKHLLLNRKPPVNHVSTGVAEIPTRAVSISWANMKKDGSWYVVNNDTDLINVIAEMIKSKAYDKIPQEKSGDTHSVPHEKSPTTGIASESMIVNSVNPKGTAERQDSISNIFTAVKKAKGM